MNQVSDNVVGSTEPAKRYRNQHLLQDELNEKIVQKLQLSNNDNKGDNNATASLRTDNERLQSLLAEPHRGPQVSEPPFIALSPLSSLAHSAHHTFYTDAHSPQQQQQYTTRRHSGLRLRRRGSATGVWRTALAGTVASPGTSF